MRGFAGRSGGILAVVQSFLLLVSLVLPAAAIASVTTDKWDYSIGETVQISGDEMHPGEAVRVEVFFPDGSLAQEHVVTAADDGTFSDTFFLAEGMPGGIYRVVATGLSSGAVFTTDFDPAVASGCMNLQKPTISGATTTSLTISWLDDCTNEDGFRIHYGLTDASLTPYHTDAGRNVQSMKVEGLACGTPYYFQVEAFKNAPGPQSSSSSVVSGATNPCPPSDTTPPVITPSVSGTLGTGGWYVSNVTVSWTVTDPESAVTATSGCGPVTITSDTSGTTLTCTATSAGGTASASVTIKRDATAPTITYDRQDPAPNANGWNNTAVTLTWSCDDATSGPVATSVSARISTEGANQSATGTCTDVAGNSASDTQSEINIDLTPPTVTASLSRAADHNGWYNRPVTITFTATDGLSDAVVCDAPVEYSGPDRASVPVSGSCTDAAGNSASASVTFNYDATAPTITAALTPSAAGTGWYNLATGAPTVAYTCADETSGIASCTAPYTFSEGANQSHTGTAVDNAGNSATARVSDVDVDLTAPTDITWSNGPQDDASYYFGFVPAAPTCTARDAPSGLAGCTVSGYGTTVGSHTMTATATDMAGNEATKDRTYTVLPWETYGFYRPVDPMPIVNTVKAGSTVPLKFEAFAGALELTDVAIVDSLKYVQMPCDAFSAESTVEELAAATGGTALRYDWTAGQFIFNWKTPPTPDKCYKATLLFDDGSRISAYFKLR